MLPAESRCEVKNPGTAAVLSVLWPGIGQIYNGKLPKGIAFILVHILLIAIWLSGELSYVGLLMPLAFWVFGVVDAYRTALSGAEHRPTKKCPRCAETVLEEATVCRYCGHKFADPGVLE
jgi:TM2 domain-containing membrane protein YozV